MKKQVSVCMKKQVVCISALHEETSGRGGNGAPLAPMVDRTPPTIAHAEVTKRNHGRRASRVRTVIGESSYLLDTWPARLDALSLLRFLLLERGAQAQAQAQRQR